MSAKLRHVTTLLNYDLIKNLELTATYQGRDVGRGPGPSAAAAAAAAVGTGGGGVVIDLSFRVAAAEERRASAHLGKYQKVGSRDG